MAKADDKSAAKDTKTEKDEKAEASDKAETAKDEKEEAQESKDESKDETKGTNDTESEAEQEKEKEKDTPEEKPELTEEEILQVLKNVNGVGHVMAQRIFAAGYDTRENFNELTVDDLKKISGIGQVMAENIVNEIGSALKTFDEPTKEKAKDDEDKPGITDKAVGFVKGTISKITGFFKGKSPKAVAKNKTGEPSKLEPGSEVGDAGKDAKKADEGSLEREASEYSGEEKEDKDSLYPEVGAAKEEPEAEEVHEPVTIEASDEPEQEIKSALKDEEKSIKELAQNLNTKIKQRIAVTEKEEGSIEKQLERKEELEIKPAVSEPTTTPESKQEPISHEPVDTTPKINQTSSSALLQWFESEPELRPEAGKLLFKAGYNNLEELKEAVVEDMTLVNGISNNEAQTIYKELRKI